jgi:hypothetical protein
MKAKVSVATVQGKAYFFIVNELKQRNIPFLSLIPGEPIRTETKVVITTKEEEHLINHSKILVFNIDTDPEILGSEVIRILQGKDTYDTVVIGVDPGQAFGLAILADGTVVDTENCYSTKETLNKIKGFLRTIDLSKSAVTVKIGSGVPIYKKLVEELDEALSSTITLEIVGEAGTNGYGKEGTHGRELRHIISAARIAGREGYTYSRRKNNEENN